ncbi:coenzyme F420-0:L-glutamate ligase [Cryobacterium tepidiphilum]|uniref:Coenzyme F420-0:L-glutamate ligase n=1 Tax=Cryobacterium tepidiphilum TaxID=2486026 RepID=A0A3M8LPI2_9MICO|nr:coenzyme F420-0:L-glutamate ligase [Cryobacterium tepidiphilum]RNE67281.1 coenzyme F420-0:L-glutamate ligase [Cryobacterium tepidiphilum]
MSRLHVFALEGIGEIAAGDDLASVIVQAARATDVRYSPLQDGDIVAVTSKIVSKAEGRAVAAEGRDDAIAAETVRVVASREHAGGVTRIVENRQGLVMAAAGVDASNTAEGTVLLLPEDPDASARALCAALRARTRLRLGVVITDTAGRAWREGQTDIAIGAAGVVVMDDLRGATDASGRRLDVTVAAVADEIAAAADLVKGKANGIPVAVVRGLERFVEDIGQSDARAIQRPAATDMFRLGTAEAHAEGYDEGFDAGFAEGKLAGFADGQAAGFAEGIDAGRAEGRERGDAPAVDPGTVS